MRVRVAQRPSGTQGRLCLDGVFPMPRRRCGPWCCRSAGRRAQVSRCWPTPSAASPTARAVRAASAISTRQWIGRRMSALLLCDEAGTCSCRRVNTKSAWMRWSTKSMRHRRRTVLPTCRCRVSRKPVMRRYAAGPESRIVGARSQNCSRRPPRRHRAARRVRPAARSQQRVAEITSCANQEREMP